MWWPALKWVMVGAPPWPTQKENATRAPMPSTQRMAATVPALAQAPGPSRRTVVASAARTPSVAPTRAKVTSSTQASLPAVGMAMKEHWDAAWRTVSATGTSRRATVILWPRIWRTTRPTRARFMRYSVVVMASVSDIEARLPSVQGWRLGWIPPSTRLPSARSEAPSRRGSPREGTCQSVAVPEKDSLVRPETHREESCVVSCMLVTSIDTPPVLVNEPPPTAPPEYESCTTDLPPCDTTDPVPAGAEIPVERAILEGVSTPRTRPTAPGSPTSAQRNRRHSECPRGPKGVRCRTSPFLGWRWCIGSTGR